MEDLNPDLFDEDFEDEFEDIIDELEEDDIDDLEDLLLDDEIDSQKNANTNIWPPVVRRGAICFVSYLQVQLPQPHCGSVSSPEVKVAEVNSQRDSSVPSLISLTMSLIDLNGRTVS